MNGFFIQLFNKSWFENKQLNGILHYIKMYQVLFIQYTKSLYLKHEFNYHFIIMVVQPVLCGKYDYRLYIWGSYTVNYTRVVSIGVDMVLSSSRVLIFDTQSLLIILLSKSPLFYLKYQQEFHLKQYPR